jgi:putative peptide zinc metalloprotease protein
MSEIFDESWYRISLLKVSISASVEINKQVYRGETWYVLHDTYNNQFFRVRPATYRFLDKLSLGGTVEEVWVAMSSEMPDDVPSQTELIKLLSQLHASNMLQFTSRPDHDLLFKKYKDKEYRSIAQQLMTFLFIKVPIWNPNQFLDKVAPSFRFLFSWWGLGIWLFVIGFGIKSVVDNYSNIGSDIDGVLAPSNLFLLYVSMALLKLLHEFGHGVTTKIFGGQVTTLGVMLIVFMPLPYVDVNSSWVFRYKWQRILVGLSGMMVELFIAAIAAIIYVNTNDDLIRALAFNVMIIGSISSLLFNGNPLLKFDAYFILSDLLEIPNLQKRSQEQWYFFIKKYMFSLKNVISPSGSVSETYILAIYAVLSLLYRFVISIGVVLFVGDQYFGIGVVVALISIYMWFLKPLWSSYSYIQFSNEIKSDKSRVLMVIFSSLSVIVILFWLIPFPYFIKIPGVVEIPETSNTYSEAEGLVVRVYVKNGQYINKGDVLADLENYEIILDIEKVNAQIHEAKALLIKIRDQSVTDVAIVDEQLKFLSDKLLEFNKKKENLHIRAGQDGIWVEQDGGIPVGRWVSRQEKIGSIINNSKLEFIAAVNQEQASDLFKEPVLHGEVKLYGFESSSMKLESIRMIPYEKNELPSAVLGWLGGGDFSVDTNDKSGKKTHEAFFVIHGELRSSDIEVETNYSTGHSGILRISLPPRSLAERLSRFINQVLQKRYYL